MVNMNTQEGVTMTDYLESQRQRRKQTGNAATKKYERTKKGKLMRTYRNMQSRVTGVLQKKAHLYEGLSILPRSDFYQWALASPDFHRLFEEWEASGYKCGASPSIDRIDTARGYTLGNMQWLSHSENSSKANRQKRQPSKPHPYPDAT